jgi:flagellar assembly protein FliH
MTATAKFLFDVDFGGGGPKPTMSLADHAAQIVEAEKVAYRKGYAAAEARAATEAKQSLAAAMAVATTGLEKLGKQMSALEARLEAEAVQVAVAAAGKLASALMAAEPQAEITALAKECFSHLIGAPHVAIRVNDALYQEASKTLAAIAREKGFEGRLVVLADPNIAPGDCRIEWADGGVVRDGQATETAIGQLVARYLGARQSSFVLEAAKPDFGGRSK